MGPDSEPERRLNLHTSPEVMAGVYANFANVSHSDYEFTITFARVQHEIDEPELEGVIVASVNMSPKLARELMDALEDAWSKYQTHQGIQNLPEVDSDDDYSS